MLIMDNYENKLTLKAIQQASLKVLVEIDAICRERNIKYTLAYGTLIGAVRHKGFIPWDDDIDIIMPRKDYENFKQYINTEYKGTLKWCDRTTIKNYPYCISRLSDFTYRYTTSVKNVRDYNMGVFVDIYPLDNYCNTEKESLKLGRRVWLKNRLFDMYLNPNKTKGIIKKVIRNIISVLTRLIFGENWHKRIDNDIYSLIKKCTNDNNQIVGVISQVEWRELMNKDWFTEFHDIEFENKSFMVCSGYDKLLSSIYGDYMKLPPENKRVPTHDYIITYR